MCPSSLTVVGGQGEGPPPVYLLNCSICEGKFSSREKWMEHLTLEGHQSLAREYVQKDTCNSRDSSLMIFTSYDLTVDGALKIIQFFGRDQTVWVTDFLWWKERQRFAIVQFESRKKAEEVLRKYKSFAGDIIEIGYQGIQMKGAFDLLDLEWKAILPFCNPAPIIPTKSSEQNEASTSFQNDKHHRLSISTTEETGKETEENLGAGEEDDSTNYVKLLHDLAKERRWDPPNFIIDKGKSTNKKYHVFTVILNGIVYKPHYEPCWFTGQAKTATQAKEIAAKFCLEELKSSMDNSEKITCDSDLENDSPHEKGNTTSPVSTLRALSQKLYGISPDFKIVKTSNKQKYFCRVHLNGKMYLPPLTTSADSAEESKLRAAQYCLEKLNEDDGISAQECLSAPPSLLCQQFTVISESVEIPDEKCQQIVEIVRSLRDVLRKRVPSTQVIIFRNWYLKLRNSWTKNDPLFLYIYAENGIPGSAGPPSEENFTSIPSQLVLSTIKKSKKLFICSEKTFPDPDDPKEIRLGCRFIHKPSGISFFVVNSKRTMAEVQCSKLVKYFCDFDPRIRPLLILARYWTFVNGIHFGEPVVKARISHKCLPEPHPLDWMILTFLMGENYVPCLRTILERPHKVILERTTSTDIGFSADILFAREWKREKNIKTESGDHFILSTLLIFRNFFEFCSTKIFGSCGVIINPKDGEVLETSNFLRGDFTSKLTTEEILELKKLQENFENKEKGKYCVNIKDWNWYMINPLVTGWRFSVTGRKQDLVTSTMKTNERLKKLLKFVEAEGAEKALEICGASLCEILKVDKEIPAIDPFPCSPSRKRPIESLENQPEENSEDPSANKKIKIIQSQLGPSLVTFDLERSSLPRKRNGTSLPRQLCSLLDESVVIPDNQFDKVLQAVNFLQKMFFHSNDPTCKVSLFRNWNLKLKQFPHNSDDIPLVYVYNRKPCEETDSGFTLLPSEKIWSILRSPEVSKKITVLEGPTPKDEDPSTLEKGWTLECNGFGIDGNKEKFKLYLFSSHKFIFEVETDNLLKYMCKFHGKAYQLIKLAYCWMGLNKLTLEEALGDNEDNGLSSLQWLVIFWMCHRKMVPSPWEIQERGNHKVMRDEETGVDLGWEEDNQFLKKWRKEKKVKDFEWSEKCVKGLLSFLSEFLKFCGWLRTGVSGRHSVVNTRNGKLSSKKKFLKSDIRSENWCGSMSQEEVVMLKAQVLKFRDYKIYMIHPLNVQLKFGLRSDIEPVLKLMTAGAVKLKKYLHGKETFTSLRQLLTLTE